MQNYINKFNYTFCASVNSNNKKIDSTIYFTNFNPTYYLTKASSLNTNDFQVDTILQISNKNAVIEAFKNQVQNNRFDSKNYYIDRYDSSANDRNLNSLFFLPICTLYDYNNQGFIGPVDKITLIMEAIENNILNDNKILNEIFDNDEEKIIQIYSKQLNHNLAILNITSLNSIDIKILIKHINNQNNKILNSKDFIKYNPSTNLHEFFASNEFCSQVGLQNSYLTYLNLLDSKKEEILQLAYEEELNDNYSTLLNYLDILHEKEELNNSIGKNSFTSKSKNI